MVAPAPPTQAAFDADVEMVAARTYLDEVNASATEQKAVWRAATQILAYEAWEVTTRNEKGRGFGWHGHTTASAVIDGVCSFTRHPHRWYALAQAAIRLANARRGCRAMSAHLRETEREVA